MWPAHSSRSTRRDRCEGKLQRIHGLQYRKSLQMLSHIHLSCTQRSMPPLSSDPNSKTDAQSYHTSQSRYAKSEPVASLPKQTCILAHFRFVTLIHLDEGTRVNSQA